MYLTKMPINPVRRGARVLLASPQAMHAAVLAGFPQTKPTVTDEGRILWRLDRYGQQRAVLYAASPEEPDFTHIVEQAGWPTKHAWQTRSYDGLLDSLETGQRWQFRLTANPVHSGKRSDWSDTKPLGHVTVRQQEDWLLERTSRLGFIVPSRVDGEPGAGLGRDFAVVGRGVRRFGRNGSRVTIATATFEGHLEVADPAALRRALTYGVGRAKAYGCGLMTLAHPAAANRS